MNVEFSHDKNQFDAGNQTAKNISVSLESLGTEIESGLKEAVKTASDNKVDIFNTISIDGISSAMEGFYKQLNAVINLAQEQENAIQLYDDGYEEYDILKKVLASNCEKVYPGFGTRLLATLGLGGAMFTEGFLGFFENVGDCFISVGSGIFSLFGNEEWAEKCKKIAEKDWAKDFIEKNSIFEWLNDKSYFDKNSTYAKILKNVGTASAAAVTTSVLCKLPNTKMLNVIKKDPKIFNSINSGGKTLTEKMKEGNSFQDALLLTAGAMTFDKITDKVIDVGIVNPTTNYISDKIADTGIQNGYNIVKEKSKDIFGDNATEYVEKKTIDKIKNMPKKTIDTIKDEMDESIKQETEAYKDYYKHLTVEERREQASDLGTPIGKIESISQYGTNDLKTGSFNINYKPE